MANPFMPESDVNDPESIERRHMPPQNPFVPNSPEEQRRIIEEMKRRQDELASIARNV